MCVVHWLPELMENKGKVEWQEEGNSEHTALSMQAVFGQGEENASCREETGQYYIAWTDSGRSEILRLVHN